MEYLQSLVFNFHKKVNIILTSSEITALPESSLKKCYTDYNWHHLQHH